MPERKQARLPEQQIEGQRKHSGDRHLRQERASEVGIEAGNVRQEHEHDRDSHEPAPPAEP
jgi:hypothetical protein